MKTRFNQLIILSGLLFFSQYVIAKKVRTIYFGEKSVVPVLISPRGAVLNFPVKPKKVTVGVRDSFGIEYVDNDLIISPMSSQSKSNLFVYLSGRRFVFDLRTSFKGHTLILIRDTKENTIRVRFNE